MLRTFRVWRAKAFSQFFFQIDPKLVKELNKSSLGRLELQYWRDMFDEMMLLGLKLNDSCFLDKVDGLHHAAHHRLYASATIDRWIEKSKERGKAKEWELEFQQTMREAHKRWCKRKRHALNRGWSPSILDSDTQYLDDILHLRRK